MLFEVRHEKIKESIKTHGNVSVDELSESFNTSRVTIRKHLDLLSKEENITRVRGGAIYIQKGTTYEPNYEDKSKDYYNIKKKIGDKSASLIHDGETIILDSGSTTWHVADQIKTKRDLTVITNDLKIAMHLAKNKDIKVFLAGGIVRTNLFSCHGSDTGNYFKKINADVAFLAADAIDLKKGITNANIEEAEVKKEMIKSAKKTILVTDSSKFNKVSFTYVADLQEMDFVITDDKIPLEYIEYLKNEEIIFFLI